MSNAITKDTAATEGCAAVTGYVEDPLLTALRNVLERVTDLRSACAERGQHVVACKLDEAYYELRSAVGSWNHAIPHTPSPATPPTTDDRHCQTPTKNPAALDTERGGVGCDDLFAGVR